MERKFLTAAAAPPDCILQVDFASEARLLLDMFGNLELGHGELLSMAERARGPKLSE